MTSPYYILVAEDDPMIRHFLVRVVQTVAPNAEVIEAPNGSTALDALQRYSFAAVITDYHMPGTTGLSIIADVRSRDATIPIIVVSARVEIEAPAREAGATYFLAKPFSIEILMNTLRGLLPPG